MSTQPHTDDFVLTLPGEGSAQAAVAMPFDHTAIQGDQYNVLKMVPPENIEKARDKVEKMVADNETFTFDYLKAVIDSYPIAAVPTLDQLLETTALRASGQLGRTLSGQVKLMSRVQKKLPEIPERWTNAVASLSKKPIELAEWAQSVKLEIKSALDMHQNTLSQFQDADLILGNEETLMKEGRVRNDKTAQDERTRSKRLRDLCVMLTLIQEQIAVRLNKIESLLADKPSDELKEEQLKLVDMGPILMNALGTLVPYIETTAQNAQMFIGQRNDDALTEWQLHIWRGPGMAQWKVNFVIKLQAAMTAAARLELQIANDALLQSAKEGDEVWLQQMQEHAKAFSDFQNQLEALRSRTATIVQGVAAMAKGIEDARKEKDDILRGVQQSYEEREAAAKHWVTTVTKVLGSAPAEAPLPA